MLNPAAPSTYCIRGMTTTFNNLRAIKKILITITLVCVKIVNSLLRRNDSRDQSKLFSHNFTYMCNKNIMTYSCGCNGIHRL